MARRRTYTAKFKREALPLVQSSGQTLRQVASDLGIHEALLQNWRRQFE